MLPLSGYLRHLQYYSTLLAYKLQLLLDPIPHSNTDIIPLVHLCD